MYKDSWSKHDSYADMYDVRSRPKSTQVPNYSIKDSQESLRRKLRRELRKKFMSTAYAKTYPLLAFFGNIIKYLFLAIFFPPYFLFFALPRWGLKKGIPAVLAYVKRKLIVIVDWLVNPFVNAYQWVSRASHELLERFKAEKKRLDEMVKEHPLRHDLFKGTKLRLSHAKQLIVSVSQRVSQKMQSTSSKAKAKYVTFKLSSQAHVTQPVSLYFKRKNEKLNNYLQGIGSFCNTVKKKVTGRIDIVKSFIENVLTALKRAIDKQIQKVKDVINPIIQPIMEKIAVCYRAILKAIKARLSRVSVYLAMKLEPLKNKIQPFFLPIKRLFKKIEAFKLTLINKELAFRQNLGEWLRAFPKKANRSILKKCEKMADFWNRYVKPPLQVVDRFIESLWLPFKWINRQQKKGRDWAFGKIKQTYQVNRHKITTKFGPIKYRILDFIDSCVYWSRLMIAWSVVLYQYGFELVQDKSQAYLKL